MTILNINKNVKNIQELKSDILKIMESVLYKDWIHQRVLFELYMDDLISLGYPFQKVEYSFDTNSWEMIYMPCFESQLTNKDLDSMVIYIHKYFAFEKYHLYIDTVRNWLKEAGFDPDEFVKKKTTTKSSFCTII